MMVLMPVILRIIISNFHLASMGGNADSLAFDGYFGLLIVSALGALSIYYFINRRVKLRTSHSPNAPSKAGIGKIAASTAVIYLVVILILTIKHASRDGTSWDAALIAVFIIVPVGARIIQFKLLTSHGDDNKTFDALLAQRASTNPEWAKDSLMARGADVFLRFQKDWSDAKPDSFTAYAAPDYARHLGLLLGLLQQLHRQNHVTVASSQVYIDSVDQKRLQFRMEAKVENILQDVTDGALLFSQNTKLTEYWTFVLRDKSWLLERIDADPSGRGGEGPSSVIAEKFAHDHGLFYKAEVGSLFLPRHGYLFDFGSFNQSIILDHMVGETGHNLIQLYTYFPDPENPTFLLLIGQFVLPKAYTDIVLLPNDWASGATKPRHLQAISLESTQFNTKFNLFADAADPEVALELLQPAFMAALLDLKSTWGLEVIGSDAYIFTDDLNAREEILACLQIIARELED